jgi:signal transduction histidine kinase
MVGINRIVQQVFEAMAAGSTTRKFVQLMTTRNGNSVVSLSVQDFGPGITPEDWAHIFDPFFSTKPSGMGLGLSISRRIIEDHGGDLRLVDTSSNGCTFEIAVPGVITQTAAIASGHPNDRIERGRPA